MAKSNQSSSGNVWKIVAGALCVIAIAVVAAAAAYIFWIDDDDDGSGSADVSGIVVSSVLFSNEVDSNGQPVNPKLSIPSGSRAVRASVRLQGVSAGMTVEGRWFQLGPAQGGAEGAEISTSNVVLDSDSVNANGASRVSFSLGTNGPALPDDSWLLRVYVDGKLVKTAGFVVGTTVNVGQGGNPGGSTTPGTTPPAPTATPRP
jgi:hypothetical protein